MPGALDHVRHPGADRDTLRAMGTTMSTLLVLVIALAGCSDRRLDVRNIEAIIADRYAGDGGVVEVVCPRAVPTRQGHRFECRVRRPGHEDEVVTVEELGGTRFRWQPGPAAAPDARANPTLAP